MANFQPSREQFAPVRSDVASGEHPSRVVNMTFNAGRNRSLPPHMIGQGECWELKNFYYPREAAMPQTRPGLVQYSTSTAMPGRVVAMHQFQKDDSTSYTICACENAGKTAYELYYLDPATKAATKIANLGTANMHIPTFATFGGRLIVAQEHEYLKEWGGVTAAAAVKATGSIVVTDYTKVKYINASATPPVTVADTINIGGRTYTINSTRIYVGEITRGSGNNDLANNIVTAVNTDSWDVVAAVDGSNPAKVNFTASWYGASGNALALSTTCLGITDPDSGRLSGGVDGSALSTINTYKAPKPGIVANGKNLRLVASGSAETGEEDRVYFSASGNAWSWAYGNYGGGEYIDIGFGDGNKHTAIVPFLDEIMIHKGGQSLDIYRLQTPSTDTSTWSVSRRSLAVDTAALNPRCAVSVSAKHLVLDNNSFKVFSGNDQYDEISAQIDGMKVSDLISSPSESSAFITVNPAEVYALVFPRLGTVCAVYHYGSRRWSSWNFALGDRTLSSGVYNDNEGVMLLGCSDGHVYKLDASVATDDGENFISSIIGPAIGSETTANNVVLHSIIDYQTILAGNVNISLVLNRDDSNVKKLVEFSTLPVGAKFTSDPAGTVDITGYFTDANDVDITAMLYSSTYGRKATMVQGEGEVVAPYLRAISGAIAVNTHTMRVASYGRAGK